jgi:hypothetical protein
MVILYSCVHYRVRVRTLVARAHTRRRPHGHTHTSADANPSSPLPDSPTPWPLSTTLSCHLLPCRCLPCSCRVVHAYLYAVNFPSPPSYTYTSPPSTLYYGYSTGTGFDASDSLLGLIIAAGLVSSNFLIQLVAICIAYWAVKQRKSCGCCYDGAGVPNCPSAQRALSLRPLPSPPRLRRHTINDS